MSRNNPPTRISDVFDLYLETKSKITGKSPTIEDAMEYLDILGKGGRLGQYMKNRILRKLGDNKCQKN